MFFYPPLFIWPPWWSRPNGGAEIIGQRPIQLRRRPSPPPRPIEVLRGGRRVICDQPGGCIVLPWYAMYERNRSATRASFQHDYRTIPQGAAVSVRGEFDAPPNSWASAFYVRSGRTAEVPGLPAPAYRFARIRYQGPSVHPITGVRYNDVIEDGFVDVNRLFDATRR